MRESPGPLWGRAASCCLWPRQISGVACCPTGVPGAAWCAVGPGCLMHPWAAARPRAVRAASFARRVVSKPGQAPPPPTGAAAWPCRRPPAPRPGPAAALRHRGLALLWSLRHNANPSNDKRPGPQPHKQTLNNVRTRPVVQCLPMWRCAYSRLGLLVWAVHPIRRHCTRSERVQRHVRGAALRNGCSANPHEEGSFCSLFHT